MFFRSLGRFFRAIGYYLSGGLIKKTEKIEMDPNVTRAQFEDVITTRRKRIQEYKSAVGRLMAQQMKKAKEMENLTEEVEHLERLKAGALAKAKKRVSDLQAEGLSQEKISEDVEYQKCLAAFENFSTTLEEKNKRIASLEKDLEDAKKEIDRHEVQLQTLAREIEKLQQEADQTVADMASAREMNDINDALSGIAADGTAEMLRSLRERRNRASAEAKISSKLAGTDTKVQEEEFLRYAQTSKAKSEFEKLVGISSTETAPLPEDKAKPEKERKTLLPEE
jgi:predicted  nucleic acid-binding Zn-ribbon protein